MIGSFFSDPKIAMSLTPPFVLILMLFSGLLVNRDNIWVGFQWIEYLSFYKYGLDGHIYNNFTETYFKPSPIVNLDLNMGYWNSVLCLVGLFVGFRILSFAFLYHFKKRL